MVMSDSFTYVMIYIGLVTWLYFSYQWSEKADHKARVKVSKARDEGYLEGKIDGYWEGRQDLIDNKK
jgi:hypothetical protein